jgi:cell division protein FtsW
VESRPRQASPAGRRAQLTAAGETKRRHKPDYWLLVLTSLLLGAGLIVVYSISPGLAASQHISQNYFITKQLVAVGLGLVAFALAYYLPLKTWLSGAVALLVLAGVCSIAVMLSPVDTVHNAHRWIRLGGFSFQAVEVIKLATLVWLAAFLARRWRGGRLDDFKATFQPLLILLAVITVVVAKLQSDLGSAAVIVAMMVIMAYAAGIPIKRIAMFAAIIIVLGVLAINPKHRTIQSLPLLPKSSALSAPLQR